jgi:Cu-Zn family superoxide dismutase
MRKPTLPTMLLAATLTALAACNANPPPAAPSDTTPPPQETPATPAPATPAAPDATATVPPADHAAPAFVDRVWRVSGGGAVEAGSTYAFLGDGTLLMDSPHGTPATGSWRYADDRLTMTEEGITYPVDIVLLQDNRFTIRSNNPGGAVVIEMAAAPDVPLPQVR